MNDRELLEIAAKAAGIDARWNAPSNSMELNYQNSSMEMVGREWNPLNDNGDALWLAVQLGFSVQTEGAATIFCDRLPEIVEVKYKGGDVFAYVRRAIVRAAAEIGKAMP